MQNYTLKIKIFFKILELATLFKCGMITPWIYIMGKTLVFITIVLLIFTTSCAQIEVLFPAQPTSWFIPPSKETILPKSSQSNTPTQALPTATPSISPTPTLTYTPKPTRTPRPTNTPKATTKPIIRIGPDNFPDYINPLTGLIAINPNLLNRRPIAIKIPNYPHSVYPQSGLSSADQVFEYHLEQGLTRFIAIFYGNDASRVGPIRSGRNFDARIVQMYNSAFVFNLAYEEQGNDPLDVYGYLKRTLDDRLMVVEPGYCTSWMCRDESIPGYNNLFANTYGISKLITQRGVENNRQDLATNFFNTLGGNSKEQVSVINVNYSYANYAYWQYDKNSNKYFRYQGNIDLNGVVEPEYILLTDANNSLPIVADNVVILFVKHEFLYKSGRSEVFNIELTDRGDAYVFRNGSAFEAIWERREKNKPLYILNPEGTNFPLKPGVTFFQVIHTASEMNFEGQEWTFKFIRPFEPEE